MGGPFSSAALWESVTLGLGVFFGLVWHRRTGWSCGGLITPGLLALSSAAPGRGLLCLAVGLVLAPVLRLVSLALGLYGRERAGAAMLLALGARLALLPFVPARSWLGWVVPGLIAADAERQGALMTLCGAVSCALVTVFSVGLLRGVVG